MECYENVDEKLVQLVKKYDNIYDKNNYTFKNKKVRESTWDAISDLVQRPRLECQQRWNVLRTRYALEKRKSRTDMKPSTWPLYEGMSFLDKFMLPRRSYGCYKSASMTSEAISPSCSMFDIKPTIHTEDRPLFVDVDTPSDDYDDKMMMEHNKDSMNSFEGYPPYNKPYYKMNLEDAEIAYGRTVGLMLKNIRGHKRRRKAQAEIMNILTKYDSGSDTD